MQTLAVVAVTILAYYWLVSAQPVLDTSAATLCGVLLLKSRIVVMSPVWWLLSPFATLLFFLGFLVNMCCSGIVPIDILVPVTVAVAFDV
jgi:hypothetical protein